MTSDMASWLLIGTLLGGVALVVLLRRRRLNARRAYGPQGVGAALERGRRKLQDQDAEQGDEQ